MAMSSKYDNDKEKKSISTQDINKKTRKSGHTQDSSFQRLHELLERGLGVVTKLWNYNANDWVSSVQAADVDNDGDVEILFGSHGGSVSALTRWGSLRWETRIGSGQWVSSIASAPSNDVAGFEVRVIAGSRNGRVYALDQNGHILEEWEESDTKSGVRQVYINPTRPEQVIVGSEDYGVRILDCATGRLLVDPFFATGAITCVCSYDIDNDGELEILAGSADSSVYILDQQGKQKGQFSLGSRIYALHAAPLGPQREPRVLVSTNNKDLSSWSFTSQGENLPLLSTREWIKSTKDDDTFGNRLYSICTLDIQEEVPGSNKDTTPKIITGSEDKHLYVLDTAGNILWKHFIGCSIYSVFIADINFDGITEIILGLEDNSVQVLHVDLTAHLYEDILDAYKDLGRLQGTIAEQLSLPEYALLRDIIQEDERIEPSKINMAYARYSSTKPGKGKEMKGYREALQILLRLRQQHVQTYWSHPRQDLGRIRTLCFGDVGGDPKDEIVTGNDEGQIFALDIEGERILWKVSLGKRIWMTQMGTTDLNEYDTLLACLADERVYVVNKDGQILDDKELVLEGERVWCVHINRQGENTFNPMKEILIGTDRKIYVYEVYKEYWSELRKTILTLDAVRIVCTADITGPNSQEIIFGCADNRVYVYNREGKELWHYKVQDHIRAICTKDIDADGQVEVIVGSEDRSVYVLDCDGHLQWRYYTPQRVLDVDVEDIDGDGKSEILVGVADGYLYVLSSEGDLRWKYLTNDRVRAVRAKDMNKDGKVEIVVGTDDQLTLLQVVDFKELNDEITICFDNLKRKFENITNPRSTIVELTRDKDEYIRAFALTRLAGQSKHTEEDFQLLGKALKDPSLEVKKGMVSVIVTLCKTAQKNDTESMRQLRRFLYQLSTSPEQEIRLTLVSLLHTLTEMDASLCFEYLERFSHNADIWIRRSVVRQLYQLVEAYPRPARRLLLEMMRDENEWVRQETGRSCAHYFDIHQDQLVTGIHDLLRRGVEAAILQQISYSSQVPLVKKTLDVFANLQTEHPEDEIVNLVDDAVLVLQEASEQNMAYALETLQIYKEISQLLHTKTIEDIVQYQRITDEEFREDVPRFTSIMHVFDRLLEVVNSLKKYRRREALGDRASSLLETNAILEEIRNDIHAGINVRAQQHRYAISLPEDSIMLSILLPQWQRIVITELRRLRGKATLYFDLPAQHIQDDNYVLVVLQITNKGRCPADAVRVELAESEDYSVIGESDHEFSEISTIAPVVAEFCIQPRVTDRPRLIFTITYDDAEKRGKTETFADQLALQTFHTPPFQEIHNPYNTGVPIRNKEMFYGREEDLEFLKARLTSTTTNNIVMLSGQRRSGKTSLMYQLENDTSWLSPHFPVLIDLQSLALKTNVTQLLAAIATCIHESLKERSVGVPKVNIHDFERDPTATFDKFLGRTTQTLAGNKLILLFDEFETLEQSIRKEQLDPGFLDYLRSVMQRHEGINFLLAGAPRMRTMTENYWATFFNITTSRTLSKLKADDARKLIVEPTWDSLQYDEFAVEKIRQLTGDQAYLIHAVCEALVRHCNKKQKTRVNTNDVNMTIDMLLENGVNQFAWIWQQSSPEEQFLLSILAQDRGEEGRVFSLADLKEEYDEQGLVYSQEEVMELLQHLVHEDFIEERLNGKQFRIPVGLIRAWLREEWPPEKVASRKQFSKA